MWLHVLGSLLLASRLCRVLCLLLIASSTTRVAPHPTCRAANSSAPFTTTPQQRNNFRPHSLPCFLSFTAGALLVGPAHSPAPLLRSQAGSNQGKWGRGTLAGIPPAAA